MKIRMKATVTGYRDGARWPAVGAELTVPAAEGAQLCASGLAEPVADVKSERAEPKQAERRARKSDEG